ncbi:hypothetical protein Tco_0712421 [Tanacetum coccineum]
MNNRSLSKIDKKKLLELFEKEIKKRLKHIRHMRLWDSFANGRPIQRHISRSALGVVLDKLMSHIDVSRTALVALLLELEALARHDGL